jgi:hypothetical protein
MRFLGVADDTVALTMASSLPSVRPTTAFVLRVFFAGFSELVAVVDFLLVVDFRVEVGFREMGKDEAGEVVPTKTVGLGLTLSRSSNDKIDLLGPDLTPKTNSTAGDSREVPRVVSPLLFFCRRDNDEG